MEHDADVILAVGALLVAGIAAAGLAARLRLPALVLFAGLGMLVGSDGLGWLPFADYSVARLLGTIALVLILFEGGLNTGWRELRPVLRPALRLAVVGTVLTAGIVGLFAAALFSVSLTEGLLLGAILAATDGAAVFALLRGARLPPRVSLTLEGESGFNDPVAVVLVLLMIELINRPAPSAGHILVFLVRELGIGLAVGGAGALAVSRVAPLAQRLPSGLALVGSLAAAALAYGVAGALGGSGFLAVYLVGLALGDAPLDDREPVVAFHRGLATVAEITMFFTLGLLVFPGQFGPIVVRAVLVALIITFVARPVAAGLATAGQRFTPSERTLLASAGLRGAVPIILATLAVTEHVPRSIEMLNIVFFAVLLSAALQGLAVQALARRISSPAAPPDAPSRPPLRPPGLGRPGRRATPSRPPGRRRPAP